jgi:uncharacterized membrane protein
MRWLTHLFAPSAASRFPPASLQRIAAAIAAAERTHGGQICFAVEAALPWRALWRGADARGRARELFSQLRVWDTAANNGVLIFVLLADHRIEIVADRGLAEAALAPRWSALCERLGSHLRSGQHEAAALDAVADASAVLGALYVRDPAVPFENELPDAPVLLD